MRNVLLLLPILGGLLALLIRPPLYLQLFPEEWMLQSALKGDTPTVRSLLRRGVPVDTQAALARSTPLMIAARMGHVETTRVLLGAGAAKEVRDVRGKTALLLAAQFKHPDVVRLLLRHGANPNVRSHHGDTPLSCALKDNDLEMARLLKKAGARE
jgi:ankyrin repeat protein